MLGLKAVNCQSGDTLAEEQATAASKEKVLDALGKTASKLRGELGESLATVQKLDVPLDEATTSSLEALKAYSLGVKDDRQKGPAAALPYFQRAIELDPNFATGIQRSRHRLLRQSELGRASEYYAKAFELREHASEREKLDITAIYYENVTGELEKAAKPIRRGLRTTRGAPGAYGNLGQRVRRAGTVRKSSGGITRMLAPRPGCVAQYANLANTCSHCSGSTKRGRPSARRRRESWIDSTFIMSSTPSLF